MDHYLTRDTVNMVHYSGRPLAKPLPAVEPFTLRFLFLDDSATFNPLRARFRFGTWIQRSDTIWDWTYEEPIWTNTNNLTSTNDYFSIFCYASNPFRYFHSDLYHIKCKVIDSETSGVTNMRGLFSCFGRLEGVEKIDTSNVVDACGMFSNRYIYSAVEGYGSVKYINSTLDFRKVKYYNGTTCHGRLMDLFWNPAYSSTQSYRLTTVPTILYPDVEQVGYVVDLSNAFYGQRNITNPYAGVVYPSYYSLIQTPGSYTHMCMNCGDLGNPTAYAAIPAELRN